MKNLLDWIAAFTIIVVIVAGFIGLIMLDDSETWDEMPDGCLLRTEITRTWFLQEDTRSSVWCVQS